MYLGSLSLAIRKKTLIWNIKFYMYNTIDQYYTAVNVYTLYSILVTVSLMFAVVRSNGSWT